MKKFLISLFALMATASMVAQQNAPAAVGKDETVVEEIVARVNNSIITREDLKRSHDQLVQELRQQGTTDDATIADRDKNTLRDLIDQQLLVQKGTDLGLSVDTDVVKRLDDLRKEMKVESIDDLEKVAQQQGVSFEDFKQNMKNSLMTQKVISQEVGGHIQFTHEEVQAYYDEHKSEFDQPERIRLAEILVTAAPATQAKDEKGNPLPPMDPTPDQIAAAEAKANQAYEALKAGKKFPDVAKQYSNGPTAADGGDLGYFKRGSLDKSLEDQVYALKQFAWTGVIRTKQGFVILANLDHSLPGLQPLKKVEPQIQETLYYKKIQPALREYLSKLRDDAYIDVRSGYTDNGASPNQTKLVYTNSPEKGKEARKRRKKFILF